MKNKFLIDANIVIYYFNGIIADEIIINRLKYKIKTPNAIIGATALVHEFEILTIM